ncbi:DUF4856 domain-containing protein [Robiginitalea sp. SC105]|uniref:DUF4856 domain-containing protein n=1 Tax=Robiginitalea sp. SC105 TaxID=2762332 RepID=UPI00163AE7CF|nr:DUF4856 domain-containing protein [Robiginitalea sp. SC105]MBC2839934.1 DUF4856 domain-containing protein [Robiginitalea sp. SC105]
MSRFIYLLFAAAFLFCSCTSDDNNPGVGENIIVPVTYSFERNGVSTVDFSGQTTRLLMGEELGDALKDPARTLGELRAMYGHQAGNADFGNADLNASDKNLKSKTAASADYYTANAAEQAEVRADFENWIEAQVTEVYPNWNNLATPGQAGQLADGTSTRYVDARGLEMDQLVLKGMLGAVMTDQALNNYLSEQVLDAGSNRADQEAGVPEAGKSYATMEHKWDEAYGYVYGLNADPANPNQDLGADEFLNKYVGRVESDPDFSGIAEDLFQAFKLGRAALVGGDYELRDEQAELIREKISEIIGIRAVYYLIAAKTELEKPEPSFGTVFHDLSEAYGFIYSLQFTRKPDAAAPYFSRAEVGMFLDDLMDDGPNGLWDVEPLTLEELAGSIASRFEFTVSQAGS